MGYKQKQKIAQIEKHKQHVLKGDADISLTKILNSAQCEPLLHECREYRERIYTPLKTLFMFLKQVLNPDKSCKRAVAQAVIKQITDGNEMISKQYRPLL